MSAKQLIEFGLGGIATGLLAGGWYDGVALHDWETAAQCTVAAGFCIAIIATWPAFEQWHADRRQRREGRSL